MGKHLPNAIIASYLVLQSGNDVLLARRSNTGYHDGDYSVPAGHVELGESFTDTLLREVQEEIGIVIRREDARAVHILHRKSDIHREERVDTFFLVTRWEGEIENRETEKCSDLSWHPIDRLPENTIPYIREALECIQQGIFYSESGW